MLYGNGFKYWCAIVLDLFFRFAWALTFVPTNADSPLGDWFKKGLNPLVTGMEIVRRAVWALFRVENEHLAQVVDYQRMLDEASAADPYGEQAQRDAESAQAQSVTSGLKLLVEIIVLAGCVLAVALISYFTH